MNLNLMKMIAALESSSHDFFSNSLLSSTVLALIAGGTIFLLVKQGTNDKQDYPRPPNPEPCHWLWGNAADLRKVTDGEHLEPKILEWCKEMQTTVLTVKLPRFMQKNTLICVADVDLAHYITTKTFPKSGTYKNWESIFGSESLLVREGDEWKRLRKTFATGFTPKYLQAEATPIIWRKLGRFLVSLDDDVSKGIISTMMDRSQDFTADVIVQFAFGEDWGENSAAASIQNANVRPTLNELTRLVSDRTNNPIRALWDRKLNRDIQRLEIELNQAMQDFLQRRLDDPLAASRTDICSMVIQAIWKARQAASEKVSDNATMSLEPQDRRAIIDQLKTFYFAGHDTTSSTISWAVWLLAQSPKALAKLRDELTKNAPSVVKEFIMDGSLSETTPAAMDSLLGECPYLDAVVKEALRLYPPAATARVTLNEREETWNGYSIGGKNAYLYVIPYVMQRLPQNFDNPDLFEPERWLEDESNKKPGRVHNTKAYIPFLKGPRDCIGKYFATLEAKIAVAAVATRYNMECINPNDRLAFRLTGIPREGCQVRLTRRAA